jgi:hypothetical protein
MLNLGHGGAVHRGAGYLIYHLRGYIGRIEVERRHVRRCRTVGDHRSAGAAIDARIRRRRATSAECRCAAGFARALGVNGSGREDGRLLRHRQARVPEHILSSRPSRKSSEDRHPQVGAEIISACRSHPWRRSSEPPRTLGRPGYPQGRGRHPLGARILTVVTTDALTPTPITGPWTRRGAVLLEQESGKALDPQW